MTRIVHPSRRLWRPAFVALLLPALAGCPFVRPAQDALGELRGADQMEPVTGVGPGQSDLRASPCACLELPVGPSGRVALPG